MRYAYPVELDPDEDGRIVVSFHDVPGALTDGADAEEALREAQDCLICALGGYIELNRAIPEPSPAGRRPVVHVPPLVAAKLALYEAMREQGLTNTALAERLGVTEAVVRRLVDLDHRSHIGQVERALALLGKRLVVEVLEAA
jgi:antitoxin HicB